MSNDSALPSERACDCGSPSFHPGYDCTGPVKTRSKPVAPKITHENDLEPKLSLGGPECDPYETIGS